MLPGRRPKVDKQAYYRGIAMVPYDLIKELSIAMVGVLVFVLLLGEIDLSAGPAAGLASAGMAIAVNFHGNLETQLKGGMFGAYIGVMVLALLVAVSSWPQIIVARSLAWMGRGLRQPIRSAMLAGSVDKRDFGKAFGFHEALDTAGALIGPAMAFLLLSTGYGFRTIFMVALVPGVLCVVLFALITRDPRRERNKPVSLRVPMPAGFWRLMAPVAIFGVGNFATAFFTLRAAQIMQPELSAAMALSAAVGFYLAHNVVGAAVSFPAGWLGDKVGKAPVLAAAYVTFAAACLVGVLGHGWIALALMALLVGAQNPVVSTMEGSLTSSLVEERRLGTAFGFLNGINGGADLAASVIAGALWTFVSPAAALGFGAVLCAIAGAILWLRAPTPSN